jgi:predicted AAA+ superfamily ATPase
MTGSQQFPLMKNVSDTLAGRIAIMELCPFSMGENNAHKKSLEHILWNGSYPDPACYPQKRDMWVKSYIQTYLERDIHQIENIRNHRAFEMFVNLCAAFHAQEFRPANLASNCGVSQPTIKSWSKVLEASYLSIMLPPFFKNFGKRIVKTSKFYFMDSSLVCALTRQPSAESLLKSSMGGALFEGLIISEVWKTYLNKGKKPAAFFWRSQSGLEVDLIIHAQGKFWPIEIKLTATPTVNHVKVLDQFKHMAGDDAGDVGLLVCNVDKKIKLPGNNVALPWFDFQKKLENIIG